MTLRGMAWRAALALALSAGALGPARAAEANQQILQRAEHHKAAAIKLWERLVNIDSGTGDAEGMKALGDIAIEDLRALGATIEAVPSPPPAAGDNIVATLTGSGKGKVLLMAHMDTVFPRGTAAARPFRIDGKLAFGPGVSDDKAASWSR